MREQPLILIVDDIADNLDILRLRLETQGYGVITASNGHEALRMAQDASPDLIMLDVMMPELDGLETVRRLKSDRSRPFVPVIMLTAKSDAKDVIAGLDAGGDDYLTKPVDQAALLARVRAMLRIKALHDTVREQAAQLERLNATLELRVAEQVEEIGRMARLKRFLSPQVAELVTSRGEAELLRSHRREIAVVVCDLRGFTAFSERTEPEEVMEFLRAYHQALGPLIHRFEGTLDRFTGDGALVFFNDPVPCPDPVARAVRMADAMRAGVGDLSRDWRLNGQEIGFGIGIAEGYATMGPVGFEGRQDYTAIGTVTNLAARLCAEAADGQILVTREVWSAVAELVEAEPVGKLELKGFSRPVDVLDVRRLRGP